MAKREDAQLYFNVYAHAHVYINVRACARRDRRGIRGVFMEYSWGIHMYRVCVGYVSGMYRVCIGTYKVRGGLSYKIPCRYLQVSKKSSTFVGNFESGSGERESRSGERKTGNGERGAGSGNRESGIKNRKLRIKIKNHEKQEN